MPGLNDNENINNANNTDNPNSSPTNRRSEDNRNDSSKSIEQYSKSLEKSAEALKESSKGIEKSADEMNTSFSDFNKEFKNSISELNRVVSQLGRVTPNSLNNKGTNKNSNNDYGTEQQVSSKGIVDATAQFNNAWNQVAKDGKDITKEFDKSFKNNTESLISGLSNVLTTWLDDGIKRLERAAENVYSSYNNYYSRMTAQMQLTSADYSNMLKEATQNIKDADLTLQFSQVDYQESLQQVLNYGLRGEEAQQEAMDNLISKKVLPALNPESAAYQRAYKRLGTQLTEGFTGSLAFIQDYFDAEALEQNGVENFINKLEPTITAYGRENGLSDEEIEEQLTAAYTAYAGLAETFGIDWTNTVLDALVNQSLNPSNTSDLLALATTADMGTMFDNSANIGEYMRDWMLSYVDQYYTGSGDLAQYNSWTGTGIGTYEGWTATRGVAGGEETWREAEEKVLNTEIDYATAMAQYNEELENLSNGGYQSLTEQQEKWNENVTATTVDTLAQFIPDLDTYLGNIWGTIKEILGVLIGMTATSLFKGSGSGSGILSSLLGKGGIAGAGSSVLSSIGNVVTSSGFGALASVLMIAGGVAHGISNANNAQNQALENGYSQSEANIAGVEAGLTGNDWRSLTGEEQVEEAKNGIDWSDVGSNALTYGLVGAGVGSLTDGVTLGLGTAIGAGVGALTGAVVSIVDQEVEQSNIKNLIKHFDELDEQTETTVEALNQSTNDLLETKELKDSTSALSEEIDTLTKSLDDMNEDEKAQTEEVIAQRQKELEYEQRILDIKIAELGADADNLEESKAQVEAMQTEYDAIENLSEKLELASGDYSTFLEGIGISDTNGNGKISKKEMESADLDDVINQLGGKESVNALLKANNMNELGADTTTWSESIRKLLNKLSGEGARTELTEGQEQLATDIDTLSSGIETKVSTNASFYTEDDEIGQEDLDRIRQTLSYTYADESPDDYDGKASIDLVRDVFTGLTEHQAEHYLEMLKETDASNAWIGSEWNRKWGDVRFFKEGTDYIPEQEQPAILHQGESVLTAETTAQLASLTNGQSFSDWINSVSEKTQEIQLPSLQQGQPIQNENEVQSVDTITDAINSQTNTLADLLTEIRDYLADMSEEAPAGAESNLALINYKGA